ncbi:MAG: outer membrane beta-barrel protein [Akkermansia sp.]|nr:outer membrane beta-barrel protein [Akkermansia sp.]
MGSQAKFIDGDNKLYPTLNFSYRRQMTRGMSASAYVSYSNENIDTYSRWGGTNYLSNETWRVGVNASYAYTPKVAFNVGSSLIFSQYSKGTNGARDYDRHTWSVTAGMTYQFTQQLSGNISYTYTYGDPGNISPIDHYNRDVISAGLSYSF